MPKIPVVVSGVGLVCSAGIGAENAFEALCRGQNGIRDVPRWKKAGFPITIGGQVDDEDLFAREAAVFDEFRSRKAVFGVAAFKEAFQQAGGADAIADGRGGVFLGVETGRIDIQKLFGMYTRAGTPAGIDPVRFGRDTFQYLTKGEILSKQPFFLPALLARTGQIRGEARSIANACSSANQAIGEAFRKISSGELDWAVAGGADDMIDEYMAIGFHLLGALSTDQPAEFASRPFDAKRKGFVLGEGAGILFLESAARAKARGVTSLALLRGYGSGASAGKITETSWEGIYQTMLGALDDAGCSADEIDYINAHGTATPMNDPAEAHAIQKLFGSRPREVVVNSTKSMIGHLIAASGAVEAVVTVQSILSGRVHPTRNLHNPDPTCQLGHVIGEFRTMPIRSALSNSLGFAGINSTLLFSRSA